MATFATVSDLQNFSEGLVLDDTAMELLLLKAERDVNRILPRSTLTNAIIGISVEAATDGGDFTLGLTWRGTDYTADPIQWNDTLADTLLSLQAMADQNGIMVPPGVWSIPESRYYGQRWAAGPLPVNAIVVEAVNSLGRQALPDLTTVESNLVGPTSQMPIVQTIVGGGLRVNPYQVTADYADALRDATCAQAEYRNLMGEDFFIRAQYQSASGPEFKTQGKLPVIGPKVARELQGTDLLQRGARARPGSATGVPGMYIPAGTTPIPDDWRSI